MWWSKLIPRSPKKRVNIIFLADGYVWYLFSFSKEVWPHSSLTLLFYSWLPVKIIYVSFLQYWCQQNVVIFLFTLCGTLFVDTLWNYRTLWMISYDDSWLIFLYDILKCCNRRSRRTCCKNHAFTIYLVYSFWQIYIPELNFHSSMEINGFYSFLLKNHGLFYWISCFHFTRPHINVYSLTD